ncbi:MAG: GHKL domain-containing protein, partial [Rhizobiales bacterium]|nr:GHKL domain-containing protein [Hyphomicrobiales bacterium]
RVGSVTSRTQVTPVVERLVRVMNKLNPELDFSVVNNNNSDLAFGGEQQDLEEMLGNLLENASKFANHKIKIILVELDDSLTISVEDDGQGLASHESEKALSRGGRIDETKPGSGLGLSIVKDIVSEYAGSIDLKRSKYGGLSAKLTLPKV